MVFQGESRSDVVIPSPALNPQKATQEDLHESTSVAGEALSYDPIQMGVILMSRLGLEPRTLALKARKDQ